MLQAIPWFACVVVPTNVHSNRWAVVKPLLVQVWLTVGIQIGRRVPKILMLVYPMVLMMPS
jgi:hypothetical protein